jgi:hypothetical protein
VKNNNPNFTTASVDHVRVTVYYLTATGIEAQQSSDEKIFYNSESETLQIKNLHPPDLFSSLKIFDGQGKIVFEKQIRHQQPENISLKFLSKGIYIARLYTDGKDFSIKFFR